jgi:hypothetical protein
MMAQCRRHRTTTLRIWSIAVISVSFAVAIAGCGSSSDKRSASSSPYGPANSPAAVSRCMRANGVSGFPDPREGPNGGGVGFPGGLIVTSSDSMVVMGIPFSGPALLHAEAACKEYLPPGGAPPAISASQKAAAIANAQCMRTHACPASPTRRSRAVSSMPVLAESTRSRRRSSRPRRRAEASAGEGSACSRGHSYDSRSPNLGVPDDHAGPIAAEMLAAELHRRV